MNQNLQAAVSKLKSQGMKHKVIDLGGSGITAQDVARLTGSKLDEICKTVVLMDDTGNMFAAFLQSDKRVDLEKVRSVFGCGLLRLAKAKELKERLNLSPGEVCPITVPLPLVVDKPMLEKDVINFGSGDVNYGIEMTTQDVLASTKAKISNIS